MTEAIPVPVSETSGQTRRLNPLWGISDGTSRQRTVRSGNNTTVHTATSLSGEHNATSPSTLTARTRVPDRINTNGSPIPRGQVSVETAQIIKEAREKREHLDDESKEALRKLTEAESRDPRHNQKFTPRIYSPSGPPMLDPRPQEAQRPAQQPEQQQRPTLTPEQVKEMLGERDDPSLRPLAPGEIDVPFPGNAVTLRQSREVGGRFEPPPPTLNPTDPPYPTAEQTATMLAQPPTLSDERKPRRFFKRKGRNLTPPVQEPNPSKPPGPLRRVGDAAGKVTALAATGAWGGYEVTGDPRGALLGSALTVGASLIPLGVEAARSSKPNASPDTSGGVNPSGTTPVDLPSAPIAPELQSTEPPNRKGRDKTRPRRGSPRKVSTKTTPAGQNSPFSSDEATPIDLDGTPTQPPRSILDRFLRRNKPTPSPASEITVTDDTDSDQPVPISTLPTEQDRYRRADTTPAGTESPRRTSDWPEVPPPPVLVRAPDPGLTTPPAGLPRIIPAPRLPDEPSVVQGPLRGDRTVHMDTSNDTIAPPPSNELPTTPASSAAERTTVPALREIIKLFGDQNALTEALGDSNNLAARQARALLALADDEAPVSDDLPTDPEVYDTVLGNLHEPDGSVKPNNVLRIQRIQGYLDQLLTEQEVQSLNT